MRTWIMSMLVGILACGTPTPATGPPNHVTAQPHLDISTDPPTPVVGQATTLIVQVFAGDEQGASPTYVIRAFPLTVTHLVSGDSLTVTASTDINSGDLAHPIYYAPVVFTLPGEWQISTKAFEGYPGNDQAVEVVDAASTGRSHTRPWSRHAELHVGTTHPVTPAA
jgi:hypothetical protein